MIFNSVERLPLKTPSNSNLEAEKEENVGTVLQMC